MNVNMTNQLLPEGTTHLMNSKFMKLKNGKFYYWCLYDDTWQYYSDQSTPERCAIAIWKPKLESK